MRRLFNMLPSFAGNDAVHSVHSNGVISRYSSLRFTIGDPETDGHNISFFNPCEMVFRSSWCVVRVTAATFSNTISYVIRLRSNGKMIWIYTRRVVAAVKNTKGACRAVVEFVRNAMREQRASFEGNNPVTVRVRRPFPEPALILTAPLGIISEVTGQSAASLRGMSTGENALANLAWNGFEIHDADNSILGANCKAIEARDAA